MLFWIRVTRQSVPQHVHAVHVLVCVPECLCPHVSMLHASQGCMCAKGVYVSMLCMCRGCICAK